MLYRRFSSQWRMSAHGPLALDLPVFIGELQRTGVSGAAYVRMLDQLGRIESEALKHIHKN